MELVRASLACRALRFKGKAREVSAWKREKGKATKEGRKGRESRTNEIVRDRITWAVRTLIPRPVDVSVAS